MYYMCRFKVKDKVVLEPKWPHIQSLTWDTFHLPELASQSFHGRNSSVIWRLGYMPVLWILWKNMALTFLWLFNFQEFVDRDLKNGALHLNEMSGLAGQFSLMESTPGLCFMKQLEVQYCYSLLDGMLVNHRITPSRMSLVPIYILEWRDAMWSKVS